ncbi:conjugal transfer protein [Nocardia nova]|uniref:conjugal transfer protein n=1 Tax=Nocardia nova TaxID=37330 RepID=UPI0033CBE668
MRTSAGRRDDSGEQLLRRMAARRRRDNAIFAVLAVLAVLGGGHAVRSWFATPPPGPSDATTTRIIGNAQLAESFAEEFVVTYLSASSGQREKLAEYVGGDQQITLPSTARQVSDPVVVFASRSIGNGSVDVWAVTVSVHIAKNGAAGGLREYFRVPVTVTPDGRRRALTVPQAVGPPERGLDLVQNYALSCGLDTPLSQVASGFLAAYLAGSGDVARYTTPNSGIIALKPAPFTAAETTAVSSEDAGCGTGGTSAKVLATVDPKAGTGSTPTLAYPLTMVNTSGQWQVQSMDAVPALRNPLSVASGPQAGDAPSTGASGTPTTVPSTGASASVPPATQN